jgi:hypothetical protein
MSNWYYKKVTESTVAKVAQQISRHPGLSLYTNSEGLDFCKDFFEGRKK